MNKVSMPSQLGNELAGGDREEAHRIVGAAGGQAACCLGLNARP